MSIEITKTWTHKFTDRARGVKYYRAGFTVNGVGRMSRKKLRSATEASGYALRVRMRVARQARPNQKPENSGREA